MINSLTRRDERCSSPLRLLGIVVFAFLLAMSGPSARGQEIDIWEYSPYKVQVWFALDPSIDRSGPELMARTGDNLRSTFKAACDFSIVPPPAGMATLVERDLSALTVSSFTDNDLVLLLDKEEASLKTLRVFETAVEQVKNIGITRADHEQLLVDLEPYKDSYESSRAIVEKCNQVFETYDALLAALRDKKINALMVPRGQIALFGERTRSVATALPWHRERVLREFEKLLIVHCTRSGELYEVAVRELDCPMRLFGPTMRASTVSWRGLAQSITNEVVRAFAPVARIETANGKVVELLNRAGGLAEEGNPVRILAGDVLQPVIRREDRRGAATLLEPIPWTFIAVTSADGIHMEGTCFSAMGNILQGKQTRRAQRVALRVRPTGNATDVKLVVRSNPTEAQPGCQIYERDLMTEELRFVGHTDWRGIINIESDEEPTGILPESIRMERAAAKRKAAEEAELAARAAEDARKAAEAKDNKADGDAPDDVRGPATEQPAESKILENSPAAAAVPQVASEASAAAGAAAETLQSMEAGFTQGAIRLRQPLVLLYAKSGDTILARLPLVPGLNEVEVADLPSDARRLEAEALMRGFQGEIMDLIAQRAIVMARVGRLLKARKYAEVEEIIREVRRMPNYKSMADTLDAIQRRVLDETNEPLPLAAKSRIDRMTQSTRDMLQKYLDNNLEQKLQDDLKNAKAAAAEEDKAAAEAAAKAAAEAAAATEKKEPPM